jgi:hypothetical protein
MHSPEWNPTTAATRVAIEFLTLWMEPGEDAPQPAAKHIERVLDHPSPTQAEAIAGLLNLSTLLVASLAKAFGAADDDVGNQAREILRDSRSSCPSSRIGVAPAPIEGNRGRLVLACYDKVCLSTLARRRSKSVSRADVRAFSAPWADGLGRRALVVARFGPLATCKWHQLG